MSLSMVGTRLREARETAGLSREQIADATKVKLERIEALEENAFDRLPSGIYLHGIIRAYARETSLNAEELIHQLRTSPENPQRDEELAHLALIAEMRSRREATPLDEVRNESEPRERAAPVDHPRRIHAFAMALLIAAVLGAFATGGYLYTSFKRDGAVAQARPQVPSSASQVSQPANRQGNPSESTRVDVPLPPPSAPTTDQIKRAAERTPRRETGTTGVARRSTEARQSPTRADRKATRGPVSPGVNPAPAVVSEPREEWASHPPAENNVTGVWRISTEVASSSVSAFRGLRLGFLLNLHQDGDRIVGSGRKVAENDNPLPAAAQTPITVEGRRDGDQLTLTFSERNGRRDSSGTFVLIRAAEDEMLGSFTSNAARSAGPVKARRR
jgi:cytoskeletal protein RodZ